MSDEELRRIKQRQALREALHQLDRDKSLPGYLADALDRYARAFWKRVDRELIAPKLVQRHSRAGLPRTKLPAQGQGAFEKAADQLGLSESTVERAWQQHPPEPEAE